MVLSLRRETEPQVVNAKDSLPLHALVFESKSKPTINSLQSNQETARPLEPFEPKPFELSELEWRRYVKQRDAARAYALENDLRGIF